jgi:EAL domain-containing protein (putative c-di-GMP-specific phosphodiesterase class I)
MLSQVSHPICIENHVITVSASLGFTLYPEDQADADTLMRHADQAMYVAKQRGKNRYHLFDQEQDRLVISHNETLANIEKAIEQDEFVLFFQPKVNLREGKVLGAEALIRWQHPALGLLPPSAFLPDIEGTELVIALDRWVLNRALEHLEQWHAMGLDICISINIAPRHLLHQDFIFTLQEHFERHATVPRQCLELEILETAALEDMNRVIGVMKDCQKLGVKFALDDFGTGYSSLTYLKALPAQTLKVDQSFIRDILRDPEDLAIVSGIINLARVFHREVIAEGVESREHASLLLKLGCEQAQGYGIAKPMPAEALAAWIARWAPCDEWLD